MVQKVVVNKCFGGWGVHEDAVRWMREQGDEEAKEATLSGEYYPDGSGPKKDYGFSNYVGAFDTISRTNELLVKMVEGETEYDGPVDGNHANLRVVSVPEGVEWEIDEYDGQETVREKTEVFG